MSIKLDSGASCNVLPVTVFSRLCQQRRHLRPGPRVKAYGASDNWLKVLGVQACRVQHRGKLWVVDFVVVDEPVQPAVMGLPSCKALDLIRRVDAVSDTPSEMPAIVKKHYSVFQGLGRFEQEHDIKLLPKGYAHRPRCPSSAFSSV